MEEELLTVLVLRTVFDNIAMRDKLPVLLDVLLCDIDPVIVVELEGVLDCLAEAVSDHERSREDDIRPDTLSILDSE